MQEQDQLIDFRRAEYYRKKYESRLVYTIIVGLICFALGYVAAKTVDKMNPVVNSISHQ